MNDQYNGWTNRETWAVHLWITNDENMYQRHRGSNAYDLRHDFSRYADECFVDSATDVNVSRETLHMILDIGSLWRVDWDAIAAALSHD